MDVDCQKRTISYYLQINFIDIVVKLSKYGVDVWDFIAKQRDKNGSVVMKDINLHIVK